MYYNDINEILRIAGVKLNESIDKEQKFLLSYPYIVNTFGKNFNIMVYGDWVDRPW